MINIKQIVIIISYFSFVLLLVGCGEQKQKEIKSDMKELSTNINKDIDKIEENVKQEFLDIVTHFKQLSPENSRKLHQEAGFRFSHIALINSDTGEKKFLINNEFGLSAKETASEIRKITPISVVGVSGVKVGNNEYQSCSYLTFDGKTTLFCKRGTHQLSPDDSVVDQEIDSFSTELAEEIENASGINNIGFLLFSDFATGKTKLIRNENYISFHGEQVRSVSAINNGMSWSVTTYKQNPCCKSIMVGTEKQTICDNTVLHC